MIRPSLRAVLLFAATLPLGMVLLAYNPHWWAPAVDLGLLVLAAIALDAAFGAWAKRLDIVVTSPVRLYVGQAGEIAVVISSAGQFRVVAEQRGEAEPPVPVESSITSDGKVTAMLPVLPHRRGLVAIDAIWLRWCGPLGLAERVARIQIDRTIDVVPDTRGIRGAALEFYAQDADDGLKLQLHAAEGSEFDALRDHAPGLDNRFIDWKRSARHRKLISKEFKPEQNHQIVLAYDTGHLMIEPINGLARLDHAINAGLLLSWVSLRGGDFVGSFGFDARVRHYTPPARGVPYFRRLQRATAELAYRHDETNFTLALAELNARLKRRALVVLFTEFIDTTTAELLVESLHRMSNRHVVIFVTLRDPGLTEIVEAEPDSIFVAAEALVAHDLLRERAIVFERLQRFGVHCLDVPPAALATGLVNRYLKIKDRGLL